MFRFNSSENLRHAETAGSFTSELKIHYITATIVPQKGANMALSFMSQLYIDLSLSFISFL